MSTLRKYFAEIGRRGGMKSRRTLDADTARRMVRAREARRAARLSGQAGQPRLGGIPADTSLEAQSIQDALWRRLTPAEKLRQTARLSRMVDALSIEGIRRRNPTDGDEAIRRRRADLRLGSHLATRVYGSERDTA
jgi:hypothetical protein